MFYVYLVTGFAIFLGGLALLVTQRNLLLALGWVVLWLVLAMAMPALVSYIVDPLNTRRIRKYFAAMGATDVRVEAFPNHYGVHFKQNDLQYYVKCRVRGRKIEWKGKSPEEPVSTP